MRRIKVFLSILILCLLLFPQELSAGYKVESPSISNQVQIISSLINKEDWANALENSTKLKAIYNRQLWKLQLLGDEQEYDRLSREIEKLKASVKQKDKKQSQVSIAIIKTLIDEIYSW